MKYGKIAIIGGGNLGLSIAKGIRLANNTTGDSLVICEKRKPRCKYLQEAGFHVADSDIKTAISDSAIIIISVKPQQFISVLDELKPHLKTSQIIVSTVTGSSLDEIEKVIGNQTIARIMPNTAIEIRESITCLCFKNTDKKQEDLIISLFNELGKTVVVQEEILEAATVLGACGIAFALRFIRAATQGGIEIGFSAELSQMIVSQTVKGAACLLFENKTHPEGEIDKVTTPQGITISGLNEMEHKGFSSSVIKGLLTSYNKLTTLHSNKKS